MEPSKQSYDMLRNELQVFKRKLDSKCEALLILSKDLAQCRQERDQFKLMAEQVQLRYQSMKRQLAGITARPMSNLESFETSDKKQQSLAQLLCEMRDVNKSLQFEVDDLKQKLKDANGDIRLLREQIVRHRLGSVTEGMDTRFFTSHEREDLVKRMENEKEKIAQLERDLQQLLDEKEEMVTERNEYKRKYENLNKELNKLFGGQDNKILDIDAVIAENRYLSEKMKQMEDERAIALSALSKYKGLLEKKRNKGILKLGQHRNCGLVISQKQVQQLLANSSLANPTPQTMQDIHSLASSLLECLNDKSTALSHQKKANRILGKRVEELENQLKESDKVDLRNLAEKSLSLMKLKDECGVVPSMSPHGHRCHSFHGDIITSPESADDHEGRISRADAPCERTNKDNIDEDMTNTREVLNKLHELFIRDDIKFINIFSENADHKDVENGITSNQTPSPAAFSDDSIVMPNAS